jgi:hypothetical protein
VQRLQHELGRLQHRLDDGEGGDLSDVPGTPRGNESAASGDVAALRVGPGCFLRVMGHIFGTYQSS